MKALVAAVLGVFAFADEARAFDCAKAATQAERLICSDPALRRADESLNIAFAAAMKAAPDREQKEALLAGQRRWLKARDKFVKEGAPEDENGAPQPQRLRASMKNILSNRIRELSAPSKRVGSNLSVPKTDVNLNPYARSYVGDCHFGDPGHWENSNVEYLCDTVDVYQNGARLCRSADSCTHDCGTFAHQERTVADIVDGEVRIRAFCLAGIGSSCPSDLYDTPDENRSYNAAGLTGYGWSWPKDQKDSLQLLKKRTDAEVTPRNPQNSGNDEVWDDWIYHCLTEPNFPKPP